MDSQKIMIYIDEHKEEYIHFLQQLIQTKSYNPPGDEQNIGKILAEYLSNANITYESYPFKDNRTNIVASLYETSNGKTLLYNGHMDTVPAKDSKDWNHPPLSGIIEDDTVMYGRGTTDMKSGLAAMIVSMIILKKLNIKLSGNLIINAVAEEETGGFLGTKWCVDNILKHVHCDFAVVGEYTGLNPLPKGIMVGEKGNLQIQVTVHGKSTHASVPFLGKNPINIMGEILAKLDDLQDYLPEISLPIPEKELQKNIMKSLSFSGTFEDLLAQYPVIAGLYNSITSLTRTCTMIHAGIKENVIPNICEAIIDFRLLPAHTPERVMRALGHMVSDMGYRSITELKLHHYTEASYFKGWKDSETLKTFYSIVKDIYNTDPIYFIFPASADAEFFRNNNYCKETILFGPGSFEVAHSVNETVLLEDYINAIKVYTLFALEFLK